MLKLYGIKNCDNVKKARKFLEMHHIAYEFVDFKKTPVGEDEINTWLEKGDLNTLFNTRGTTYRTLKLKTLDLTDKEKIKWLAKENMLIKRPVIVFDGKVIIGYNETEYSAQLLH